MPDVVLAPVTLVVGEEEFLVAREISRLVNAVRADVGGEGSDLDVRDLAGAELTPEGLAETLSPSLFGDRRVVVIRDVQDCPKEVQDDLVGYAADPLEELVLALTHAGGAKGKATVAALQKARARIVECPKVKWASERLDFVKHEIRAEGGRATDGAVRAIVDAVGTDLRELATAVSQLVSDTGGQIDEEVVSRYYRGKAEATGFVIADRVVEGDVAGALELLRWGHAVGLAPVLVTSAIAGNIRAIAKVASASRGPAAAIAKQLGMPTWKVERVQRQARGWHPDGIAAALAAIATADGEVKGGAADAGYALERAVLAVAAARGR
jgi:DNA polymerase-3 subunit delta